MIRALVLLAGLVAANGQLDAWKSAVRQNGSACALNGASAVDELLDAGMFIMASMKRCSNHQEIRCSMDVAAAVESVNAMINVILKAVDQCGALNTENKDCGLAVSVLTRSAAGLAGTAAGIVAKCPNKLNGGKELGTVADTMGDAATYGGRHAFKGAGFGMKFGMCVINVKSLFKSLFMAIKRLMVIKEDCDDPNSLKCGHNVAKVMSAFLNLGSALSGAVGKCVHDGGVGFAADCAAQAIGLVKSLNDVDRAGTGMAKSCQLTAEQRLYLEEDDAIATPATNSGSVTLALAALLPFTAVVSFVGGKRLAKSRSQSSTGADCEALVASEE